MAQQLDLQEQEQVDALKAFWAKWGNQIVWAATIVLAAFAGWNYWLKHERDLALQASTLYGELEAVAQSGDAAKAASIFGDMKARVPKTAYAQQAGLLAAKVESDKGKPADAIATLQWVADNGNEENAAVARLRLAGLLADAKKPDDALKQLDQVKPASFAPLVADRRGDILLAKGDKDGAKNAYKSAFDGMPATQQYRFVVEAKLTALGAAPAVSAASAAASAAATGAGQ
jgi:predicted negative regulator of RcsB-dependent stress response